MYCIVQNSQKQKELEKKANIESSWLYEGKIFSLRRDVITVPKQPPHYWDIVVHPGAVAILPIQNNGDLVLIRQWRRAIGEILYEIPAGLLEKGESPDICAQRETQEETGYRAKKIIPFGGMYTAPGFCNEYLHLFLAKDLEVAPLPKDIHEAIDVEEIPLNKALELIDRKIIIDSKTISVLLMYQRWQGKNR